MDSIDLTLGGVDAAGNPTTEPGFATRFTIDTLSGEVTETRLVSDWALDFPVVPAASIARFTPYSYMVGEKLSSDIPCAPARPPSLHACFQRGGPTSWHASPGLLSRKCMRSPQIAVTHSECVAAERLWRACAFAVPRHGSSTAELHESHLHQIPAGRCYLDALWHLVLWHFVQRSLALGRCAATSITIYHHQRTLRLLMNVLLDSVACLAAA